MRRDDNARVLDIVQAGRKIARFIGSVPREQFAADDKTVSAVERQLEIITEAATRLSPGFCAAVPDINWEQVKGMRLILAHDYHRVDVEILTATAYTDVPKLVERLEPLLPEEST